MKKVILPTALAVIFVAILWPQSALAIERDSVGVYLIGSTADFEEFCDVVNTGNPFASARVTADGITVRRSIGLGDDVFHFRGKFDGQGHTLTLDTPEGGVFANTEAGCVISNVNLSGKVSGNQNIGSLINFAAGTTIMDCSSNAIVDASHADVAGGLVGKSHGTITLDGCAFTGQVTGGVEQSSGLIGWNEHSVVIRNCQVMGTSLLAGNLKEGANIVENTRLGNRVVAMTVEEALSDSITNAPQRVKTNAVDFTSNGITYTIDTGSGQATVKKASSSLTSVQIPEKVAYNGNNYTVTKIGGYALSNSTIQYARIPKTVVTVENDAFHECTALKEVVFDDGPTTLWLGRSADYTFVEEELFYKAPINKVYIGRNLSWNGTGTKDEPFEYHDKLVEITFGPRVTVVGNYGDHDCTNNQLFNNCKNVSNYSFLGDEQSLGTSVNFYCSEGFSNASKAYISRDFVASNYTEYTVAGTGWGISDRLENVTYGPFATYVTSKMYSGVAATPNKYLKTVDFSNATHLSTIQSRAFADADLVKAVDFTNTNLTKIESEGFYDCDLLETVNFGDKIETIGANAFDDTHIVNIHLPASLKKLGYKAFYDCDEAVSLVIDPGEGEIVCETDGGVCNTFVSCGDLTSLYLGRNLSWNSTKEKGSPFYDSYFVDVVIDNAVTKLGAYMFQHSNKLKNMSIGSGINEIPSTCFNDTEEVTSLILVDSDSPITLGASFGSFKTHSMYVGRTIADAANMPHGKEDGNKAMEIVQFGPKVNVVWENALVNYPNLKTVTLPANVTVKSNAFKNCGIEEMYVQGDACFKTNAVVDCNKMNELTVVGALEAEDYAFNPASGSPAMTTLNVFFKEDPQGSSGSKAFPQSFLNSTVLNNLYDTPYQKVEFSQLPWSGFKNRNSFMANDYAPSSEVVAYGHFDHAYVPSKHKADKYFTVLMPFDVSTYYFGPDAKAYDLVGFTKKNENGETFLATAAPVDLDGGLYFAKNLPYVISSSVGDSLMQASIDQFRTTQVTVDFVSDSYSNAVPYLVFGRNETISPSMGNIYVLDEGCLKKVNGDYLLPAFTVAFKAADKEKMHINDGATGDRLVPDEAIVTSSADLLGYVTFYSSESSFHVEDADVYTITVESANDGQKHLVMKHVTDSIVSQCQGVLIKALPEKEIHMQMVTTSSGSDAYNGNVLKGVDVDTPVGNLGNIYVLGRDDYKVGFFPYGAMNMARASAILPANHAYIDSSEATADDMPFIVEKDLPTSVDGINAADAEGLLYDLSGRRVVNPERHGIYIKNGQKIIQK